jgi:hypothetical protein
MLGVKDVAVYLNVSHLRGTEMYAEGKFPEAIRSTASDRYGRRPRSSDGPSVSGGTRGDGGSARRSVELPPHAGGNDYVDSVLQMRRTELKFEDFHDASSYAAVSER